MSLLTLLKRTLDDPLQAARSRRAIGYLGWDVPVELILAADAVPVQLSALPHAGDTALADRFLENSFSAQSRIVADRWMAGDLDFLDVVVFSRSDDNAQRLYYYLCELQRVGECKGPRPVLYDLARIQRGTSVEHTIESTRSLAAAIDALDYRLSAAIRRVTNRDVLLSELAKLRMKNEVPPGSVAYRIVRGARAEWSDEFDLSMQQWLANHATVLPRQRLLLVGSVPADDHVHAAIEMGDTVVVGEINAASATAFLTLDQAGADRSSAASADPLAAVARRCYQQTSSISTLLRSPADIVAAARALRVDGVIVWLLATDTGLAWEAPRIERALRDASVPTLMLTSQPQTLSTESLTRIAAFRQALEAR